MKEEFKKHKSLNCMVSNTGKVISYKGNILVGTTDRYRRVLISDKGKRYYRFVHRLVYETFKGEIPEGLFINHIDSNKLNNHIDNLELVSSKENIQHYRNSVFYKIHTRGEDNGNSILNEDKIIEIYSLIKEGKTNTEIAKIYGVNHRTISQIKLGTRWKHLFNTHFIK